MIVNPVRYVSGGSAVAIKTVKVRYGSSAGGTIYGTLNGTKFTTTLKGNQQHEIQLDVGTYFTSTAVPRTLIGATIVDEDSLVYQVDA